MNMAGARIGAGARKVAKGAGAYGGEAFKGTFGGGLGGDFMSSFAQHAFGTKGNVAGALGRIGTGVGTVALLGNAVKYGANLMYGDPTKKNEKKPITKEEQTWRDKVSQTITRGTVDDYTPEDLDLDYNNTDEGWRAGIGAFSKDEFNSIAKTAIQNNDAKTIWNAVARRAKANGKEIKMNKPVIIPGIMNKDGKQLSYAIAFGDDQKPRLVKIQMGKGVVWDE